MSDGEKKKIIIGDYLLTDYLGGGGMGEVYRAVHKKIGRVVAVKKLKSEDGNYVRRFLNEAWIQARLQHPNIATLYDYLEHEGHPYIVMEYVDGQTLGEYLGNSRHFAVEEAVLIFRGVVEAIAYLHQHGIIHRDIKPNNIKISSDGQVKLLDFGIAKIESSDKLTVTGGVIGTPLYLAPEQIQGAEATPRTDVWQLGILFYEMLSARTPFSGATKEEVWMKVLKSDYPNITTHNPAVPRQVEAVISRCLKRKPTDRYSSGQELLRDLENLPKAIPQKLTAPAKSVKPLVTGGRKFWLAIATTILLLCLGLAAFSWLSATQTQDGDFREIEITVTDGVGVIEVYSADGRDFLGPTPYKVKAKRGEQIQVQLKGKGFDPYDFKLTVEHSKPYAISLKRSE